MKARKVVTVDDQGYEIAPMITSQALKVWTRLTKLVLPALGAAGNSAASLGSVLDSELNLERVASLLTSNLTEDEVLKTVKDLLSPQCVSLDGGMAIEFETHFAGRLLHLTKLLGQVLEVNYGDFFEGIKDILPKIKDLMTAKPSSQIQEKPS